jgi:predicted nucleic acid-binding protein
VTLTYVDASVLIAGVRGQGELPARVLAVLDDPDRSFAASVFLKLEVLPQARFHKRAAEVAFYERFFAAVTVWATDLPAIAEAALEEASTYGVEAMDALHVVAAASVGATELVTLEKPSRAIHRARAVKVVSLYPDVQ